MMPKDPIPFAAFGEYAHQRCIEKIEAEGVEAFREWFIKEALPNQCDLNWQREARDGHRACKEALRERDEWRHMWDKAERVCEETKALLHELLQYTGLRQRVREKYDGDEYVDGHDLLERIDAALGDGRPKALPVKDRLQSIIRQLEEVVELNEEELNGAFLGLRDAG